MVVGVDEGGQVVVVQDGAVDADAAGRLRAGVEHIRLGTEEGVHGGDGLLTDGVERWIGHLGEALREEVVEHPRALGEGGDGGVGTHRAEGLGGVEGHRGDDELDVLLGDAEDALAQDRALVRHVFVAGLRQVGQRHEVLGDPRAVIGGGGEAGLDLLVGDDAPGGGVDEEHAARLDAGALDHVLRLDGDDAGLGGHDDGVVGGDPDASRPQAVAVEDGADELAVGEGDSGRAVPGLHEAGVVLVEVAQLGVDGGVVLPGLRDHHGDGVRQGVAAEVEELEGLVETRGVGGAGGAHRQDALEGAEGLRVDEGLAGAHPVLVTGDGVDLTVVGDQPVGVRQRPRRECVGGEARVHQGDGRGEAAVGEVEVEAPELRGGEHTLVHDGACRQRREVDGVLAVLGAQFALAALAHEEHDAVELEARLPLRDEEGLVETRHGLAGGGAQAAGVDGHLAPAEDLGALLAGDVLDLAAGVEKVHAAGGQEGDAGGVVAGGGQLEADDLAVEGVGDLEEHAGAVTGVRVGSGGAAVVDVGQDLQAPVHDASRRPPVQVRDEADAAGVMLVGGVVEPPAGGRARGCGGCHGASSLFLSVDLQKTPRKPVAQ